MDFTDYTDDELDQFVTGAESAVGRIRTAQMRALREVDRRQTPTADGCRSLIEWVTGRLDVAPDTARTLVATARHLEELPMIEKTAASGELGFDRTLQSLASPHPAPMNTPCWPSLLAWTSPPSTAG